MKSYLQNHPVLTFLGINFAWTWLFWLAAIPLRSDRLLLTALVMIGGFGPALAGVLTLGFSSPRRPSGMNFKRLWAGLGFAALLLAVFGVRYAVGNIPAFDTLADDLRLTAPVLAAAAAAAAVGGWVYSSAFSSQAPVRERMASLLPRGRSLGWGLAALFFYPTLILLAWGLAALLGLGVEFPGLWGRSIQETLPLYALIFTLTALAQGGNEEPGWRGFLQPELEKRFSPLAAALWVSVAWSLWHLPLYLNGFYAQDLVGGMLGGFIFRILLSIFLAWAYRRSGGSLLAMILLHTSFNCMVNFLPTSDVGLLILWVLTAAAVVIYGKMWQKPRPDPAG